MPHPDGAYPKPPKSLFPFPRAYPACALLLVILNVPHVQPMQTSRRPAHPWSLHLPSAAAGEVGPWCMHDCFTMFVSDLLSRGIGFNTSMTG